MLKINQKKFKMLLELAKHVLKSIITLFLKKLKMTKMYTFKEARSDLESIKCWDNQEYRA